MLLTPCEVRCSADCEGYADELNVYLGKVTYKGRKLVVCGHCRAVVEDNDVTREKRARFYAAMNVNMSPRRNQRN